MLLYAGQNSDIALDWARTGGIKAQVEMEHGIWFVYLKSSVPVQFEKIMQARSISDEWRPACIRALFAGYDGDADRPVLLPAKMGLAPAYKILDGFGLT